MLPTILVSAVLLLCGGALWLLYFAPKRDARRKVDEMIAIRRRPTLQISPRPPAPQPTADEAALEASAKQVAPPDPESSLGWIVGISAEIEGQTYKVARRPITIGRGTNNYIQIAGKRVSRVHCQLLPTAQGLRITDLKSSNHTIVNGRAVRVTFLRDKDVIDIGGYQFVYEAQGNYEHNAGLAQKDVGEDVNEETSIQGANH